VGLVLHWSVASFRSALAVDFGRHTDKTGGDGSLSGCAVLPAGIDFPPYDLFSSANSGRQGLGCR
jgi:hypothetical protein